MVTMVFFGVFVIGSIEALNLFHMINHPGIVFTWIVALLTCGCLYFFRYRFLSPSITSVMKHRLDDLKEHTIYLAPVSILILALGLTALSAAPNNYDSMTYHLGRVGHWIQNQSVNHYATPILRQLVNPPFSEFVMTHVVSITRSDRLVNLVQWFYYCASLLAVTVLAREFKASLKAQVFCVVFVATMPMAILQASSTQNDLVASFHMISFVYFFLYFQKKSSLSSCLLCGFALGLLPMTKMSAYVFLVPWGLWIVIDVIRRFRLSSFKYMIGIFGAAFLLNMGHFFRNLSLMGRPIGLPKEANDPFDVFNKVHDLPSIFSVFVRNVCMHFGTPFETWNRSVMGVVERIHQFIGRDPHDPATSYTDFQMSLQNTFEDIAGSPLHLSLILLSLLGFFFVRRFLNTKHKIVLWMILAGVVVFCGLIKWSPWHTRLHMPLFMMVAPWVCILLAKIKPKALSFLTMLVLMTLSGYYVAFNETRPWLGKESIFTKLREEQYFSSNPGIMVSYLRVAKMIRTEGYESVGLNLGVDDWEYPLWILSNSQMDSKVRIEHVDVLGPARSLQLKNYNPDIVICSHRCLGRPRSILAKYMNMYGIPEQIGTLTIFRRK